MAERCRLPGCAAAAEVQQRLPSCNYRVSPASTGPRHTATDSRPVAARSERQRPTVRASSSSRVQPSLTLPDVDVAEVKAVLFDMDGVLCASEDISRQAATEAMRELYGLEVDPDDFLPFTGTGEANFLGEGDISPRALLLCCCVAGCEQSGAAQRLHTNPVACFAPSLAGGVARKYGAPFELESCKAKFFEIYMSRYAVPGAWRRGCIVWAVQRWLHQLITPAQKQRHSKHSKHGTVSSARCRAMHRRCQPLPTPCCRTGAGIGHEGARQLVEACRAAGLKLAVASSADRVKVRPTPQWPAPVPCLDILLMRLPICAGNKLCLLPRTSPH